MSFITLEGTILLSLLSHNILIYRYYVISSRCKSLIRREGEKINIFLTGLKINPDDRTVRKIFSRERISSEKNDKIEIC